MLKLYLICLICFLFLVSILLSTQIYSILNSHFLINYVVKDTEELRIINVDSILYKAKNYVKQKKWLKCILMLEKKIIVQNQVVIDYYNCIGFCYYCLNFYELAEYYYCQALYIDPSYTLALSNLAKVYILMNKYKCAINLYNKVLQLDKENLIAKTQLQLLKNKRNRDSRI